MLVQPDFLDIETWRTIVKNNKRHSDLVVDIVIETEETWLPKVLAEHGLFVSNSQVKKNRPDLWRDMVPGETISLNWCEVLLTRPA